MTLVTLVLVWLMFALLAGWILSSHDRFGYGFALGLLLGPLGVAAALIEKSKHDRLAKDEEAADRRACPHCAETIRKAAKICKHCDREVPPAVTEGLTPARGIDDPRWKNRSSGQ